MPLSKEEIAEIVRALREDRGSLNDFFIDPKEHYDQHQRIDRFLDIWESTGNVIFKTIIALIVAGGLALAALGFKFGGGK